MAKTLLQMRTEVLYMLGDTDNEIWSAVEVDRYINEGQTLLASLTKLLWEKAYLNDTAGVAIATLPADYQETDRVTWNWARVPMLTADELRVLNANYKTEQGPVRGYTLEEAGGIKLRKWLVPSVTATITQDVNNTRLEYFRSPAALVNTADLLTVPDRATKYVRHYAMYRCFERRGPGAVPKLADHFKKRFYEGAGRMIARLNRVQTAGMVGVMGGGVSPRSPVSGPRLPWNFGRVVRYNRW